MLHLEFISSQEIEEFWILNALYLIAKINIADKNFIDAHFALTRAIDNHFQSKRLTLLHDFIEGVLYLIKRKIKKGIQKLSDLIEILKENDTLYMLAMNYRSYGYVAIEKYELALLDIKKIKRPPLITLKIYSREVQRELSVVIIQYCQSCSRSSLVRRISNNQMENLNQVTRGFCTTAMVKSLQLIALRGQT